MAKKIVQALIGDGQELEFTYGDQGFGSYYDGIEVTIRPALSDEAFEYLNSADAWGKRGPQLIVKHLVSWNVGDLRKSEEIAPGTLDTAKRLPYPVSKWLIDCILGYNRVQPKTGTTLAEDHAKNSPGPSA